MKINQKELRAWAWWVLSVITAVAILHGLRFEPVHRESDTMALWDRLHHRFCYTSANVGVCFEHEWQTVATPTRDEVSSGESRLDRLESRMAERQSEPPSISDVLSEGLGDSSNQDSQARR